jgi:hypothetical protein
VYSGLLEILKDRTCYYHSTINSDYSKISDIGEKEIIAFLRMVGPEMLKHEEQEKIELSKKIVWEELKK